MGGAPLPPPPIPQRPPQGPSFEQNLKEFIASQGLDQVVAVYPIPNNPNQVHLVLQVAASCVLDQQTTSGDVLKQRFTELLRNVFHQANEIEERLGVKSDPRAAQATAPFPPTAVSETAVYPGKLLWFTSAPGVVMGAFVVRETPNVPGALDLMLLHPEDTMSRQRVYQSHVDPGHPDGVGKWSFVQPELFEAPPQQPAPRGFQF